jgi:hypothetical protein
MNIAIEIAIGVIAVWVVSNIAAFLLLWWSSRRDSRAQGANQ